MIRAAVILGAALAVAGCETTSTDFSASGSSTPASSSSLQAQQSAFGNNGVATTFSEIDPRTGQRVVTGGSFVIGSGTSASSAMAGRWTLADNFARRCTLTLKTTPLPSGSGAMQVDRDGFCSIDFSNVAGWLPVGNGVALTDDSGRIRAQLVPDNRGGYSGSHESSFGSNPVKLTRGEF